MMFKRGCRKIFLISALIFTVFPLESFSKERGLHAKLRRVFHFKQKESSQRFNFPIVNFHLARNESSNNEAPLAPRPIDTEVFPQFKIYSEKVSQYIHNHGFGERAFLELRQDFFRRYSYIFVRRFSVGIESSDRDFTNLLNVFSSTLDLKINFNGHLHKDWLILVDEVCFDMIFNHQLYRDDEIWERLNPRPFLVMRRPSIHH